MPRPKRCRRVGLPPGSTLFKPAGVPARDLDEVVLAVDEFEALRLADYQGLYHEQAAERMGISRQTFGRIVETARKKVAQALVMGLALRIQSGQIDVSEMEVRTYFDQSAGTWDNEPRRIALMRAVGQAILREAQPTSDMDVLDYGCGTGLVSLFLLPHVRSVTGADNSPGMLDVLRRKIAEGGIARMKVMPLNLEEEPAPNEKYHLIVTSMTMHHVANLGRVLSAFHALLRPNGQVCIADLDVEPGIFHSPEAAETVHHHGFDRQWLKSQLTSAGFAEPTDVTVHEVYKPTEGGEDRAFPIFLLVARQRARKLGN